MLTFLRNFFTPTEENRGVPVCLSGSAFLFYVLIGLTIGFSSFYAHRLQLAAISSLVSFSKNEIIAMSNNARIAAGLSQLQENSLLGTAADKKAKDMLAKQYFAHTSPDNKTPWFFIKNEGYQYSAAGENLAIDYVRAADAHTALMESPTHRANILSPLYTQVGVAVVKGVFENRESILIVQFFGKPKITTENKKAGIKNSPREITTLTAPPSAAINKTILPPADSSSAAPATQDKIPNIPIKTYNPKPVPNGEVLGEKTETIISYLSQEFRIKLLSWGIIGLILTSLSFLILRGGTITVGLFSRSLFLILVFGYIFFFGIKSELLAKIQPVAQSVVEISK